MNSSEIILLLKRFSNHWTNHQDNLDSHDININIKSYSTYKTIQKNSHHYQDIKISFSISFSLKTKYIISNESVNI